MIIESIILCLFFGFIIFYLGFPLFQFKPHTGMEAEAPLADLELKKDEMIQNLKDIELDYQTKKISYNEYKDDYDETFAQGTKILEQIEKRSLK